MTLKPKGSSYLLFILLFLIFSCAPQKQVSSYEYIQYPIQKSQIDSSIERTIMPYRDSLEKEMNEVIGISEIDLQREKGKPETLLGNFTADLVLERARNKSGLPVDFCVLNFGGLRSNIGKGPVTKGAVFELMPFENEIVVLKISSNTFLKLLMYLASVGGQPISGFQLEIENNLPTHLYNGNSEITHNEKSDYYIATSDYLANGGDNMSFFSEAKEVIQTGYKLRDAIIDYIIQNKTISSKLDGRIKIIQ